MGQHAELGFCLTSLSRTPLSPGSHWDESAPALRIKGANSSRGPERAGGGGGQNTSTWVWIKVKCALRNGRPGENVGGRRPEVTLVFESGIWVEEVWRAEG